ncbi:slc47a1, partial [Symbiodinium sp. CCMP2592]
MGRSLTDANDFRLKKQTAHLAGLARRRAWEQAAAGLFRLRGAGLDAVAIGTAISACRGQWLMALALSKVLIDSSIEADVVSATSVISACERGHAWQGAVLISQNMMHFSLPPDTVSRGATLSACEKGCQWTLAFQIGSSICSSAPTNSHVHNSCLSAGARATEWKTVLQMMQTLCQKRGQLDVLSYSSTLHSFDVGLRWQHSLHVFSHMQTDGPQPNVVTASSAISAASAFPRGGAWALQALMQLGTSRLQANTICCNAAVSACAASSLWAESLQVFDGMLCRGPIPSMVTHGALMAVVEGVGKWLDVLHLLASGQRLGLQPTLVTCATSLAACRYGRWAWTRAVQLFASHFEGSGPCGPWPTLVVANAFLGALSTFGQWRTVAKVLEDLCMWRLRPDHHTLASAASALSRDTDVWMQTVSLLQNFGMQPDYSSLETLLSICEWQPLSCSLQQHARWPKCRLPLAVLKFEKRAIATKKKGVGAGHRLQFALCSPMTEPTREAALLQESRPDAFEPWGPFCKKELKGMWALGWPIAVSMFCRFAMFSMDSACVGHLNRPLAESHFLLKSAWATPDAETPGLPTVAYHLLQLEDAVESSEMHTEAGETLPDDSYSPKEYLAASTLSDMITNFLTTPLLAMAFGLNPLIAQSVGSGNLKMVGTWLKLSFFCVTLGTIPFITGFFFVDEILTSLRFDPDVCYLAGVYARYNSIWVLPNSWYVTMRMYFQAQGKPRPAMYFGLIFLFVNALFLWLLVFGGPENGNWWHVGGLGFIGAALSISCSRIVQSFFYWLYMFVIKKAHAPTWPGMGCDFLQRKYLKPYFAQVLPQVGTMLLQFLISQSTTLLVGKLGKLQVSSSSAAAQATVPITVCLLITFSSMTAIRVGMKLGKGLGKEAAQTAWLCLGTQAALTVLFAAVALPLRKEFMSLMTNDPQIRQLASELLVPITLNFLFAGAVSTVNGGILASQGRTYLSAVMVMLFELPLSLGTIAILVLAFHVDVHVVYWVQAGVTFVEAVIVLLIISRSDWDKYAEDARARNQITRQASGQDDSAEAQTAIQQTDVDAFLPVESAQDVQVYSSECANAVRGFPPSELVDLQAGDNCVICQHELKRGDATRPLPCGHSSWHDECFLQWLTEQPSCPICRAMVGEDGVNTRIFPEVVLSERVADLQSQVEALGHLWQLQALQAHLQRVVLLESERQSLELQLILSFEELASSGQRLAEIHGEFIRTWRCQRCRLRFMS